MVTEIATGSFTSLTSTGY